MLRVNASPPAVHEQLWSTESVRRLARGDALDQAMYGSSLLATVVRDARTLGAQWLELDVDGAGDVHTDMAAANHLLLTREVLKMWRELPVTDVATPTAIALRPF